ncbi:hypothetical protein C0J52_08824 [Blattella germanica]|nr:hypothetical protein C0J52_08824 [Blattella germanica]
MQAFADTHSNTLIKILSDDSELMKRTQRNRLFPGSLSSGLLVSNKIAKHFTRNIIRIIIMVLKHTL